MKIKIQILFTFLLILLSISNGYSQMGISSLDQLDPSKEYWILNVHDNKALCTRHNSKDPAYKGNQEPVILYNKNSDKTHLWKIKSSGNGSWNITNTHDNRALCTIHNSKDPNYKGNQEPVILYTLYNDKTHQWKIESSGSGIWNIRNSHDNRALCTLHNSKDPNHKGNQEPVILYNLYNDKTHQWKIVENSTTSSSAFTMAMVSDPQYPWLPESDSDQDLTLTDEEKILSMMNSDYPLKSRATKLNEDHVASINKLANERGNMKAVIINGDLTAFGHDWQRDEFDRIYSELNKPMYVGLGNHDYSNNVDDTYANAAANNMVDYLIENIESNNITGADYSIKSVSGVPNRRETTGSMAYSWDEGNIHFVQLNNYPTYEVKWWNYITLEARERHVFIKSSLDWLESDLSKARAAGKAIVLNYHDSDEHWDDEGNKNIDYKRTRFSNILKKYRVGAVFVGHYHESQGQESVGGQYGNMYGSVPVFYCGSASQSKFLLVQFEGNRMKVEHVNSKDAAATCSDGGTYTLPTPKENVEGIQIQAMATYRLEIDACHSDLYDTDTGNKVTIEWWSGSSRIEGRYRVGLDANCTSSDETFTFRTNRVISHIIIKTDGGDAYYIDELRIFKNDHLVQHHGRDNGSGWCLSTDSGDIKGEWEDYAANCLSSLRFNL